MPSYEFTCRTCGKIVTQSQPITEAITVPTCNKCGQLMIRSYSFGSVTFNGSGFYSTDKYQN